MTTPNTDIDFLDLPDEQVMTMTAPVNAPAAAEVVEVISPPGAAASAEEERRGAGKDNAGSVDAGAAGGENADGVALAATSTLDRADDDDLNHTNTTAPVVTEGQEGEAAAKSGEASAPGAEAETAVPAAADQQKTAEQLAAEAAAKKEPTAEDHKALYERLLGRPIKANGKEIQLQSPEEAERLIQMGLNYTKKMQAMQPALRVVKMLENNGLLDETKLSHLIDISKGDSGAIQKLLADKGFDPMSADAEQAAKYVPANHGVTDLEMRFNAVLEDVEQSPAGIELITEVHGQWDADSKQALYRKPEILSKLSEQKALGLYDQISGEVERLRALGQITPDIPFLQAYHAVGDMLHEQGRLKPKDSAPAVAPPAVPVETRVAAPTPVVKNTPQAHAAAPVRTAPSTTAKPTIDYLSMDDAEFAKQTMGRF